MKCVTVCLLLCVILVPMVMAADPGPKYDNTMIFDVPRDQLMAMYGRLPGRDILLASGLEDECPDFRCHLGDTLKMLVILIEWNDRPHTYSPETMDSLMFSHGYWPGGSVAEYIDEVSYGNLAITGKCEGWFNAGVYPVPHRSWDSVAAALDPYIDYSQYDGNGDGVVDAICFLQAGSSSTESEDPNDVLPLAWIYRPEYYLGPFDGMMAGKFHTSGETSPIRNPDNLNEFTGEDTVVPIISECHELAHNVGLQDLYDYDSAPRSFTHPDDKDDHPMVDWCLMDGSQERNAFEITMPAHFCGWSRMKLQWLTADTLNGEYEDLVIYNIGTYPDSSLYLIPIAPERGEYFLLEYRNPYSTQLFGKYAADFSAYFYPALDYGPELFDRGLLVTHVYDSVQGLSYPFWFISNNGAPDWDHYAVRVVDAGYDPDRDYTYNPGGDVYDGAQWWYPYETRLGACFSSDVPGQTEFGPHTSPSSAGYFGRTGVYVRVDSLVGDRLFMYVNTDSDWYLCGDADGDGEVTIDDARYLVAYLHKDGPAPYPLEAGDANGDGSVDQLDCKYLIEYLHKDGPEPICP